MPATPVTWLEEQTVNTVLDNVQREPNIIQLADGRILVTWTSAASTGPASPGGTDLIGQIYDVMGNRVGGEFIINNFSQADDERSASIAALPSGGFIAVYEDNNGTSTSIRLNEYNANGLPVASGTTVIEDSVAGDPVYRNPQIATSGADGALVIYEEVIGGKSEIVGRIYNASTDSYGAQFFVLNAPTGYMQGEITTLSNGNYLVAGIRTEAGNAVAFTVLNPAGGIVVSTTSIPGISGGVESNPTVAALGGGSFAIAYTSVSGTDSDVLVRVYSSSGVLLGSSTAGTASATNGNSAPSISGLPDGSFVVTYQDAVNGMMVAERFSSTGASIGSVSYAALGSDSAVVGLGDGRFATTWISGATGEISLEILDPRDAANATAAYSVGNETQVGTIGADTFTLAANTDRAYGGLGNDRITATGQASLFGGEGDDVLLASATNIGHFDGGVGIDDWVDYANLASGVTANLASGTSSRGDTFVSIDDLAGGSGNDTLIGDASNNILTGRDGNDYLIGGEGSDALLGGAGSNILQGGLGNDRYTVASMSDTILEFADEGVDTVYAAIAGTFVLQSNIEDFNASQVNGGTIIGIGNELDNDLFGRSTHADELYGRDGNDELAGGTGAANFLAGGTGDDLYIVRAAGDSTYELAGEGTDTVETAFGIYGLQQNIENLRFTDNAEHLAGVGNNLDNRITGGSGRDDLFGREGNDALFGGTGVANTMLGQEGDDTYFMGVTGDTIIEFASEGVDTVRTRQASYVLPENVEQLIYDTVSIELAGGPAAQNFTGIGNSGANFIFGGAYEDFLSGMAGDDVLQGYYGLDTLLGGDGADQFRFDDMLTVEFDRILDFQTGTDKIAVDDAGFGSFANFELVQGAGAVATSTNATFLYDTASGMVSFDADGTGAGESLYFCQLNAGLTLSVNDFMFY